MRAFYEQFVEHRRILTAQKDEVPHPKREVQNFLLRLDERYAEMITSMDNGSKESGQHTDGIGRERRQLQAKKRRRPGWQQRID